MSHDIVLNTGNTLSLKQSPGEDLRFPNISTESIFTYGDFRMHRDLTPHSLSADSKTLSFSNFGTISSLSANTDFGAIEVINIEENDLNIDRDNPNSYAYFGSFYSKVAAGINNIIENFPYALLAYRSNTGATLLNYVNNYGHTASFSIPISAITNQGNIIYASGYTTSNSADTIITLFNNYEQFEIELSSTTLHQTTYAINSYSHNPVSGLLNFTIQGNMFTGTTSSTTVGIYIRPSKRRYYNYKKTISDIEYQLLFEQRFLTPNIDDDTFESVTYTWPTTIDGFNPDSFGDAYDDYVESILNVCTRIDDVKTNWMLRTMIPENYTELDSEGSVYRKLITVYADEFDKIKKYIDNMAYAHTVTYSNEESIPDKFLHRLSTLLGWEPINEFNEVDIFSYLAKEDSNGYTYRDYNFDLWKKILININWLYKKKGTRDALEFVFKLLGAPDCLIHFDEFVYKINQATTGATQSYKIGDNGYPNYDASSYVFQEGGLGRGNGNKYIEQWEPEFSPIKNTDNIKVHTGDTSVFGTSNIMNSKEVNIELSPASAIECDVIDWYNLGLTDGSATNDTVGIPDYIRLPELRINVPTSISAYTMSQWMDYVYTNSIDPTKRKTEKIIDNTTFFYKHLKDIYLTYYYWNSTGEVSNRLNFRKLEPFLDLIQRNFTAYIYRLLPATTIVDGLGVLYRNTMFNRQMYVYKKGINDGSEFQIKAPVSPNISINGFSVNTTVNDINEMSISVLNVAASMPQTITPTISAVQVTNSLDTGINETINAVVVDSSISVASQIYSEPLPSFAAAISPFPATGTPQGSPPATAVRYTTRTATELTVITSTGSA